MKILHLANVGGETRGGGVHEVAYNFFRYQTQMGIDTELWFPGTEGERDYYSADKRIRVLSTFLNPNYGLMKEIFLKKNTLDFDILHQHGIWLPTSLISIRFRKQKKNPTIIQPHGYLEPYAHQISKFKKRIAKGLYEERNLNESNVLIACSQKEYNNLRQLFPYKHIATIPNGVQHEFILAETESGWQDRFYGKRKMLFLSRIHPIKGLPRFLKALSEIEKCMLNQWVLLIAGFEELDHKKDLLSIVDQLGLQEFVHFVGPKFGNEKIELMSKCDLFILPSFSENYGIVVAESLARETPVLTTKGTPWEELESRNCGFWAENSEEGIKSQLEIALRMTNSELRDMGKRGKELVLEKYTWEKTTLLTKELYTWMHGGGSKPDFVK